MRLFIHKLLSALICEVARNFWHGETSAENALVLVDGCITMRKWLVHRGNTPISQVYLVFSFILLQADFQGDSRSRQRRCSPSGDSRWRELRNRRDWPCANLAYHALQVLFSSLLFSRRTLPKRRDGSAMKKRRRRRSCETRVHRNDVRHAHARGVSHGPRSPFCVRSRWYTFR